MRRGWLIALLVLGCLVLGTSRAKAVDPELVRKAMEKGVQYLRRGGVEPGIVGTGDVSTGLTALIGLTLLECDVDADDAAVQRAAKIVREASPGMTDTYTLSLGVMFLDRLGAKGDVPLIESMAVRLMAGQTGEGGWGYKCPQLAESEMQRIRKAATHESELKGSTKIPKEDPKDKRTVKDLPKEIQDQLIQIASLPERQLVAIGGTDNSNTQFATLALWVSRRHGLPVDKTLEKVGQRFRLSQHADGGWGYMTTDQESTPSMTCAGLFCVGAAFAAFAENKEKVTMNNDACIKSALAALGTTIGQPLGQGRFGQIPNLGNRPGYAYYFLFSLERVAVTFGLDTIMNKDWYNWGAEILIANQQPGGEWVPHQSHGAADTCFALLFLARANLARDMATTLKGKLRDPGKSVLRGEINVDKLKEQAKKDAETKPLKPQIPTGSKPTEGSGAASAAKPAEVDAETASLSARLVKASGAEVERVLGQFKSGNGPHFSLALATTIPKLNDDTKKRAREALAERLSDMKSATLKGYLDYDDAEIRRAAALACAMKEDKTRIPDLINLLQDPEPSVLRAAHAALKSLSGKDFGPGADANQEERRKAYVAWKEWWNTQGSKP